MASMRGVEVLAEHTIRNILMSVTWFATAIAGLLAFLFEMWVSERGTSSVILFRLRAYSSCFLSYSARLFPFSRAILVIHSQPSRILLLLPLEHPLLQSRKLLGEY